MKVERIVILLSRIEEEAKMLDTQGIMKSARKTLRFLDFAEGIVRLARFPVLFVVICTAFYYFINLPPAFNPYLLDAPPPGWELWDRGLLALAIAAFGAAAFWYLQTLVWRCRAASQLTRKLFDLWD